MVFVNITPSEMTTVWGDRTLENVWCLIFGLFGR